LIAEQEGWADARSKRSKDVTMDEKKEFKNLVAEPIPLLKPRKGGALNLIYVALLLEAARMVDDGADVPHIEAAAKKAFDVSKGFLSQMDDVGIPEAVAAMEALSEDVDPEDPVNKKYLNFFEPSESCRKKLKQFEQSEEKKAVRWVSAEDAQREAADFILVDLLKIRFQAVSFITAVEVVEAGLLKLIDVDKAVKKTFQWKEGPFSMMNRLGLEETMILVTEKMQLSHRQEINFPIPRLLISQVQKNEPWPLNSKVK
jgi:3-hydroxyacyl-CoA dehydrogenase